MHAAEPLASDPALFEAEIATVFKNQEVIRREIRIKFGRSWSRQEVKRFLLRFVNTLFVIMHLNVTYIM
jgi:hypothetical protein